ncbi:MAG: DUF1801 domain-containing protein [Deltaproteobacteria bacterium]|nr:DUF1801 domain-containing protein [Deltaproteobacteria bacterium]
MKQKIESVDQYFLEGCGRCEKGATPDCKIHRWPGILAELRRLVRASGLIETLKWSMPAYTHQGKNVVIVSAFNDYCSINFFQGALLEDEAGLLEKAGEKTQAARVLKFTELSQVKARKKQIQALLAQAIAVAESGARVDRPSRPAEPLPRELEEALARDAALREAWEALTPGRRRSHLLHLNQAKQAKTRLPRIERQREAILAGRGFNER